MVPSGTLCRCSAATIPGSVRPNTLSDTFGLYRDGRHAKRSTVQHAPNVTALLPQPLASVLDLVAITAAVGGLALSALPLLTGKASKDNADRPFNPDTEEEDFSFALAGVVSFLPYANWTAWVLRAFTEEGNAALYYAIASAYAVPWVTHDLRLDGFTAVMLLLGAVHVQVERLAATSPVEVRVPGVYDIAQKLSSTIATPARDIASAAHRKSLAADQRQPVSGDGDEDKAAEDYNKQELKRFDDTLSSREKGREK